MLIIKVESHNPHTKEIRTLGVMQITNQGGEDETRPNYEARVAKRRLFTDPRATVGDLFREPAHVTQVEKYPRWSDLPIWHLVTTALLQIFPRANDPEFLATVEGRTRE